MSTLTEDRLTAALRARAEQVGPEDLGPLEVPATSRSPWRPVLAGLAAAATVAAVAVPLALHGSDDARPTPPSTSTTPTPSPSAVATPFTDTSRAEGDVDGDGADDLVRTDADGVVRVDLANGSLAELQQPLGSGIEGLAKMGGPGLAVVLGIDSGDERPAHVLRWVDGGLEEVEPSGDAWIGSRAGQTFWVEDQVLFTGTFQGNLDREVRVQTRAWEIRDGVLRSHPMGQWCWLPSADQPHPVSCSSSGSFDVGPRGDLPALFPAVDKLYKTGEKWSPGGPENVELVGRTGEYVETGDVELVVHLSGIVARADVPAGGPPELVGGWVRTRGDAPAFLVRQEGGDSMTMTVFTFWNGELIALPQPTDTPFGNGFREVDGSTPYHLTWLSEDGVLYTAEGIDEGTGQSRSHLWRWSDDFGDRLTSEDLGVACIDFSVDPVAYGRCP